VPGPWEGCHLGPGSRTVKDRANLASGRACLRRGDPVNVRITKLLERLAMKPIVDVIAFLLNFYMYIVIAAVILSWLIAFNVINTRNQVVAMIADFLYRLTEPVFRPIRNVLPNLGGIDFSPLIVLLIIYVLRSWLMDYIRPIVP
jgi:YggT family protein